VRSVPLNRVALLATSDVYKLGFVIFKGISSYSEDLVNPQPSQNVQAAGVDGFSKKGSR
jgi:hypothetical protein